MAAECLIAFAKGNCGLALWVLSSFWSSWLQLGIGTSYTVISFHHLTSRKILPGKNSVVVIWNQTASDLSQFVIKANDVIQKVADSYEDDALTSSAKDTASNADGKVDNSNPVTAKGGWQVDVVIAWLTLVAIVTSVLAALSWFVFFFSDLPRLCREGNDGKEKNKKRLRHSSAPRCCKRVSRVARGHQHYIVSFHAAWSILHQAVASLLLKLAGFDDFGSDSAMLTHLHALSTGVAFQKLFELMQINLQKKIDSITTAGAMAWHVANQDADQSNQEGRKPQETQVQVAFPLVASPLQYTQSSAAVSVVRRSAQEIVHEAMSYLNKNITTPSLQKAVGFGIMAAVFNDKPYGLALCVVGIVDKHVVHAAASQLISFVEPMLGPMQSLIAAMDKQMDALAGDSDNEISQLEYIMEDVQLVLNEVIPEVEYAKTIVKKIEHVLRPEIYEVMNVGITHISAFLQDAQQASKEITSVIAKLNVIRKDVETGDAKDRLKSALSKLEPEHIVEQLIIRTDDLLIRRLMSHMGESKAANAGQLMLEPYNVSDTSKEGYLGLTSRESPRVLAN